MDSRARSLLALHVGMVLLGGTALFAKLVHLPASDITVFRSAIAGVALLTLLKMQRRSIALGDRRDYALVAILGVLLGFHWVTFFHAMQVSTVAVGVVSLFTFPVMIVFLEPLFDGEPPHWIDAAAALVVVAGVYLMVPRFDLGNRVTDGIAWGLFSALLYALRNVIQRRYFTHHPAELTMLYQVFVVAVVIAPLGTAAPWSAPGSQWLLLAILGVMFTALPHTFFALSLIHFKAKTVGLINCLQVFYATLFAAIILGERPSWQTLLGGVLIVGTAAFESMRTRRPRHARRPAAE